MSVWGTGIYQNDTACDIRESVKSLRTAGCDSETIGKRIVEEYANELADEDERIFALTAIADQAWKVGALTEKLKEEALLLIDSDEGLRAWEEAGSSKLQQRRKALQTLKERLQTEQRKPKPLRVPTPYVCAWNQNDVYRYRLKSEEARRHGIE